MVRIIVSLTQLQLDCQSLAVTYATTRVLYVFVIAFQIYMEF